MLFRSESSQKLVKLITIAPEIEGALAFISNASKQGIRCSLGHSAADYMLASEAFLLGACHVTHLYNAMPPYSHREPGIIGAAIDHKAEVELICDGIHIHPSVVRATFSLFDQDNLVLISDSMRATGMEDGKYDLGGQEVNVKGNLATLTDGTIAGSATNLFDCMKKAIDMGIGYVYHHLIQRLLVLL